MKRIFFNDKAILYVIISNMVMTFACGFWTRHIWIDLFDALFTLFFVVEAAVKIREWGWRSYWQSAWNRLDFIVLLIALPSLADPFVEPSLTTNALLCLRILRIFKSLRVFRHVPNIRQLVRGAGLALRSSYFVCISFLIFLIIFATLSSVLFGGVAPEYFGNPAVGLYSTFRLFTVEGWYELPDTIAANSGPVTGVLARLYFGILLFAGGIIGMSLINSIFVDAMVADNNDEVMKKLTEIERTIRELKNKQS